MIYLDVLKDIGAQVADPELDSYKKRAKDHFLRALAGMVTAGDYTENDVKGYIKLKTDLIFSTNPYDANALNILKIIGVLPDPLTPNDFSAYFKEFEDLRLVSQIAELRPGIAEVFVYQVGIYIYAVYRKIPGAECLDEIDFATHAKWDRTNDIDDTGGNAEYTWSANQTSTLTQTAANQIVPAVASEWYQFTYTINETTPFDGDGVATITTAYSLVAKTLPLTTGTHTVYFKSAVAPTDFVISIVSGSDTEGQFSFDNVTLKRLVINSNFNPTSDVLTMKYVEDIDGTGWADSADLTATPRFLSDNFIRRGINIAAATLLKEVQL